MSRQIFRLTPQSRRHLAAAIDAAPDGMMVEIKDATRTLEQNARLWAMLTAVAQQVEWFTAEGATVKPCWLTPEEWKDVFTAAWRREKVVPGINGGFVIIGRRTSQMTKREMGELQELIAAFAAERGVRFPWDYGENT
jgi:hypothetical protein